MSRLFVVPTREYLLVAALTALLLASSASAAFTWPLVIVAGLGALPTFIEAWRLLRRRALGIDAFNAFAVVVAFATGEYRSTAFIALMLTFARLLDWRTSSRAKDAIAELMKLKPLVAVRVNGDLLEEVPVDDLRVDDVVLVKSGARVPVDGMIVQGRSLINESSVTGESALVEKTQGDRAIAATLVETGAIKVRAAAVGADSTIERMAALMRSAAAHKTRTEKLADRFAGWFLPLIGLAGVALYAVTRDAAMTAALFLVACADDMAVAIPLAMTASIGIAAGRGVVVKGGQWLEALSRIDTLVLDKTGTLTFGGLVVREVLPEPWIQEKEFLHLLACAEKFSEHPVGRALARKALDEDGGVPDPEEFQVRQGSGVVARCAGRVVAAGNEGVFDLLSPDEASRAKGKFDEVRARTGHTTVCVIVDGRFAGLVTVADAPRPEAAQALKDLRTLGITRIIMCTGDNERTAREVASALGIDEVHAGMLPKEKLRLLEELAKTRRVGMIGDGINDAPALARAQVGIAMGGGGAAVAVEAADIVILTDDLSRLPETIALGRRTMDVIRIDVVIWVVTNLFGFALVVTGVIGPALAALYNLLTDFLPIANSARLFRIDARRTER